MAQYMPPASQQQSLMRMLLLAMMLKQMQQQGANRGGGNKPSGLDQFMQYVRRGRSAYNNADQLYQQLGGNKEGIFASLFGAPSTSATTYGLDQIIPTYTSSGMAANEAANTAWNAGAQAATNAEAGSSLGNYGGWLAAGLSLFNDSRKLTSDNLTDEQKALEAQRMGPRAAGAFFTGGLSVLGENMARKQWPGLASKLDKLHEKTHPVSWASKLWTSDKWKTEGKRINKLLDQGVRIPDSLQSAKFLKRGRRPEELINKNLPEDYIGFHPQYGWANNKFAKSRQVSDLRPEDIWGYTAFFEKYKNDWLEKFSEDQRRKIAEAALSRGAVKEHHGTIDVNWTPELEQDAQNITGGSSSLIPKAVTANAESPQSNQNTQQPSRYIFRNGRIVLKKGA